MATRAVYRAKLIDKLVALEDGGYGDFDYSVAEYNTYLELAVARLYPALYKRLSETALAPVNYGTNSLGYIPVLFPDRVFLVEEVKELEPMRSWRPGIDKIFGLERGTTYNVYYHDAYTLPGDDETDAGIGAVWTPLIVMGALIEALESRQDTGVRGDDPNPAGYQHVGLLDRLVARYESLKSEQAMSLPVLFI